MKVYRFKRKEKLSTMVFFAVISTLIFLFIFLNIDISISKPIALLVVSVSTGIYAYYTIYLSKRTIEEIIIQENNVSIYFVSKNKKKLVLERSKLIISDSTNGIIISKGNNKEFIGEAYKDRIENPEDWDVLVNTLNSNQA